MWHKLFSERLNSWADLRSQAAQLPKEPALELINQWWFDAPWIPYHLHWDDRATWPDPWQLLDDNLFCSLARGLGIMYTITLLDRADIQNAVLTESCDDNLVLIDNGKYILNWDQTHVVNINLGQTNARHSVSQAEIQKYIK
jgi:hypothetical protein